MQAIKLRDIDIQVTISTQPGIYKWYMHAFLVEELNVPVNGCHYEDKKGTLVYIGIANSMHQRLVWHVTHKHSLSQVKSGFLSTRRQTLSALAKVPMDDTDTVDRIIDMMSVEFKYCETKDEAAKLEQNSFQSHVLPLNIMGNKHPFTKELKRLRKESKGKVIY